MNRDIKTFLSLLPDYPFQEETKEAQFKVFRDIRKGYKLSPVRVFSESNHDEHYFVSIYEEGKMVMRLENSDEDTDVLLTVSKADKNLFSGFVPSRPDFLERAMKVFKPVEFIRQETLDGEKVLSLHREVEIIDKPTKLYIVLPENYTVTAVLKDGTTLDIADIEHIQFESPDY